MFATSLPRVNKCVNRFVRTESGRIASPSMITVVRVTFCLVPRCEFSSLVSCQAFVNVFFS